MKKDYKINLIEKFESESLNKGLILEAWVGHRNFAYDIVSFLEPENIVELGTHHGCSFFAMAQAIKDYSLNTQLVAVDTWQGEEHAGFYDESIYEQFVKIKNTYYQKNNIVIHRMLFDEALKKYEDEYFDIIHIDGLHTYEAVTYDFNTWLPKLKKNGIVLFHDVYSLPHFGTNRFWQEIKNEYECHFEFLHCYGLGVLFPKGDKYYQILLEQKFKQFQIVYSVQYTALLTTLKNQELNNNVEVQQNQLHHIQTQLDQTTNQLHQTTNQLHQTTNQLHQTQQYLSAQYENNSLSKIVKNRLHKKLVHEKWAKYSKPMRYGIYGLKLLKMGLQKMV